MDAAGQKFMALSGVQTWAYGTIQQAERLDAILAEMCKPVLIGHGRSRFVEQKRAFDIERMFFLHAARQFLHFADWTVKLGVVQTSVYDPIFAIRGDIIDVRDMNEHVVEYYMGGGRNQGRFVNVSPDVIADASSTVDKRIGNRVDWGDVANLLRQILPQIPNT
jgi:hypothetical protein